MIENVKGIDANGIVNSVLSGLTTDNISATGTLADDLKKGLTDVLKNQLQATDTEVDKIIEAIGKDLHKGGGGKGKGKPPKGLPPRRPPQGPQEPPEPEDQDPDQDQDQEGQEGQEQKETPLTEEELNEIINKVAEEIEKNDPDKKPAKDGQTQQKQQGKQGQEPKGGEQQGPDKRGVKGGQEGEQPSVEDLVQELTGQPQDQSDWGSGGQSGQDINNQLRNKLLNDLAKVRPDLLSKLIQAAAKVTGNTLPDSVLQKMEQNKREDDLAKAIIEQSSVSYSEKILRDYLTKCIKVVSSYKAEEINKRIEGMWGSFEDVVKIRGNIVVIADVSGSMDKPFMASVIKDLYEKMRTVASVKNIQIDLIVFSDNFKIFLNVPAKNPEAIVSLLKRVSSGGTHLDLVLRGLMQENGNPVDAMVYSSDQVIEVTMRSLLKKCVGMMLFTDFEIGDDWKLWVKLVKSPIYFNKKRIPILNLCITPGQPNPNYYSVVEKLQNGSGFIFNCVAIRG